MALDAALREDVPGAAGWLVTEQAFREQTYDSPYFDPATYLAARGEAMAIAEADETNVASGALLGGFGARVAGVELEMSRV